MKFLHAADLHIDSPLRGLDRYEGAPVERLRTATRRALERLVDAAIVEEVEFVLLAGDIFDRDWQDFRTGLFFREQMVRLRRAGIPVFIVQGNHDAEGVISRQLALPDNVTVFASRAPETRIVETSGAAIHGQSFPDRRVDEDLVPAYPAPVPDRFNIGLLHTSLTGRAGHDTYAPTSPAALVEKGYDYWALGHVHRREVVHESPRIVYPGNLQGRHANETGPKGCELVAVEGREIRAEFIALDVVRWSRVALALDGVERLESLGELFHAALAPALEGAGDRLHAVRVELTGATPLRELEARRPGTLTAAIQAAAQDVGEAEVWVERVVLRLAAPIDRSAAARGDDALGELVRLVDEIAGDDETLAAFAERELGALMGALPPEVAAAEAPRLDDPETLRALLADAEATVLARLAESEDDA